mmetsp:Transcript_5862/g.12017  ORF Transcript_5862/g.12017 Transcript_5862/m.12017 type:complete len:884 (+) Transcript_5862:335-2986(+)
MSQMHPRKRSSLRKSTASVWMMMIASRATSATAYTLPGVSRTFTSSGRKRCIPSSANGLSSTNSYSNGQSLSPRKESLYMALDSRELRFYASSSSPIARSNGATPIGSVTKTVIASRTISNDNNGNAVSSSTATATTYYSSSRANILSDKSVNGPRKESNHDLLDSLASPALSTYANSILGMINSFDSNVKRAFSHPTGVVYATQYSTSSVLFNSSKAEDSIGKSQHQPSQPQPRRTSPIEIDLTDEEKELFELLRTVTSECGMKSTLRVAGGWVRDKILASKEFKHNIFSLDLHDDGYCCTPGSNEQISENGESDGMNRITSKFKGEKTPNDTLSVTVPVDIDIALDDKLGREFADELNQWLSDRGRKTHSVGVVLKNPEKSKHLETATMRVNNYWIDFVNLRAEEYTSDSRIPDLMRIGTAEEDAFRRDLTINSLFYNINEGVVEDMTGRGLDDLRKGIVATPLPPLTTLLDDPLRVLRSVRFAARLRFGMAESLRVAAADSRVKAALAQKVSRERVGSEVDLMLKSRDPVGAMRLLINLGLIDTVFLIPEDEAKGGVSFEGVYEKGLNLLATAHDHLCDCKANPPMWCESKRALESGAVNGVGKDQTRVLMEDEDARRLLWYAAFLKPIRDRTISIDEDFEVETKKKPRKAKRSIILKLLVDELKRPLRDAEAVDKIMRAADGFTKLVSSGSDVSALSVLLSGAHVVHGSKAPEGVKGSNIMCTMDHRIVDPDTEDDPVWKHCMEFRLGCADILRKIGPLWRAAIILSLCEQLAEGKNSELEYMIEGDVVFEAQEEITSGILANYDAFAAAIMQLGLIGIWNQEPLVNGDEIKKSVLPNIPKGPVFREVMDKQTEWMITHPGGTKENLVNHLREEFPDYA